MRDLITWRRAECFPALSPHEVHIWRTSLEPDEQTLGRHRQLLTTEEQVRAERFLFVRDRHHFITARAILRTLLGSYLQQDPRKVMLTYGERGKPALAIQRPDVPLEFNLSHSAGMALYAFTLQAQTGVDIEFHRDIQDLRQLAATVFSASEQAALDALPATLKKVGFYAAWTRKEAFIKAIGEGVAFPLDRFDVSLTPGEPARLLRIHGDPIAARRWQMVAFTPAEQFSGALVVENPLARVSFWEL
jgi:4'-phosphopantetheinyl transferase